MNCHEVSDVLDEFVNDECHPSAADLISEHVTVCPKCSAELDRVISEREIYTQFLFDAEPASGFESRFFARLDAEAPQENSPRMSVASSLLNALTTNLRPVFGVGAFAVLAIITVSFYLAPRSQESAGPNVSAVRVPPPSENAPAPVAVIDSSGPVEPSPERTGNFPAPKSEPAIYRSRSNRKPDRSFVAAAESLPTADQMRNAELKSMRDFAADTARQIENVEQLLRSFRNARFADESGFDVAYERDLAGRLLSRNLELRRRAEALRDPMAAELLDRVQPYLTEISNLGDAPDDEIVLSIKQRVRNQNVIASLQGF